MTASITRRSTFDALSSDGHRTRHGAVRVRWISADHPAMEPDVPVAIAFAFGRRFGSAVDRNRAKRRLRTAFRDAGGESVTGALLLSGTRQILDVPYPALVDDLRACLRDLDTVKPGRSLGCRNASVSALSVAS